MHDPRFFPPHGPYDPDDIHLHEHDDDEPLEQGFVPPRARPNDHVSLQPGAAPPCPKCHSSRVHARHRARKTGGTIGAIAGTASGVAFALPGAETGAAVGALAGPAGAVCGAIAGAVIAGLIGGTAGCAAGSVFGEVVDDKVLDNFRCHACGNTFSRSNAST
ncbi:complement resistance protein TraT [Paraburkholderia sacchari]|uniref:complement resistance protein TraT n=1 Tax=Paraburkholderia sacchari TaxID=159450 RepID=UPI001FD1FC4F|nr:complement resistance protein TraT [Paraburkholderia sacchari]